MPASGLVFLYIYPALTILYKGHVLVKNERNALPLKSPRKLSVFGYDAPGGLNSSTESLLYMYGLANMDQKEPYEQVGFLLAFAGALPPGSVELAQTALNGTLITGGGSGAATAISSTAPLDALQRRAAVDNTTLLVDSQSANPLAVDPSSDACLVFINALAFESADRTTLADGYSDNLVLSVASRCSNTIVVIHNAGTRLVDGFVEHENVTAVIFGHVPGQASGDAIVEILYGHQSPSGRLPYTVAKKDDDYGELLNPVYPQPEHPFYPQSDFNEGVHIDYRFFLLKNIKPRYEYGYGLTFSNFSYGDGEIHRNPRVADISRLPPADATQRAAPPEGGLASLFDVIASARITVRNTGNFPSAEVAQLYLAIPNSGVEKALRGFDKKLIQPGHETTYTFPLRRRDLSIWSETEQQWVLQSGEYGVFIGKSVLDIQWHGTLSL